MTPRIEKLRERAIALQMTKDPNERTVLVTESWRQTEGLPPILRRAKALEHILLHETIHIFDGELIAGAQQQLTHCHRGVDDHLAWLDTVCYPEWRGWWGKAHKEFSPAARQALEYWRGRPTVGQRLHKALSPSVQAAMRRGVCTGWAFMQGHCIPDFEMVLNHGLNSLIARAQAKMAGEADPSKRAFWEAVCIVCRAAIRYAERHADQGGEMCRKVPAQPAETFHEALQSVWLVHRVQEIEMGDVGAFANSFGRFDQYLYPFYERDLRAGRLSREQALELVESFWVKMHRTYNDQHLMLGGLRPDGTDATNELSHICLEALAEVRLPLALGVRVHKGTPRGFLERAAGVARLGMGRPHFYNDEVTIPALVAKGVPVEDARNYAVVGCVEVAIPGRGLFRTMAGMMNLTKCLELALNDGRCMLTGEQVGPQPGHEIASYETLHAAYRQQVAYFTRRMIENMNAAERLQAQAFPHPFLSAVTDDCVEKGRDVTDGGARYNATCPNVLGIANLANSLAAIRRVVFAEKRVALGELVAALKTDFGGHEDLRQLLMNRCPKYGNDDEAADAIARDEMAFWCGELEKCRNTWGEPYFPLLFAATTSSLYHMGPLTAASADGRRAKQPLAISASPAHGTDRLGPTAALKSVAKIDYGRLAGGASVIIDLHPTAVAGSDGKLAALIRTYFEQGGMEVGINVVGEEMLREAQRNPERFRTLSVRIFGYSALFVNLSQDVQEYVIAKTKHTL